MKNLICLAILTLLLSGCEDFLDTESYTKKNTGNFPVNQQDAEQMITGIYSTLNKTAEYPHASGFMIAELAADDRFGGGGTGRSDQQAIDHLMKTQENPFEAFWSTRYAGIYRANLAIETLDQVKSWESEEVRNRTKAEAYFLRAYFYFDLSQIYGEVPLVLQTAPENRPKSPAEETYAQIASDLQTAINLFPSAKYNTVASGHATKWTAEALMARVFLFYTGYYQKDVLPLPDGGKITKEQVIAWIDDCIANSGHDLVADFRNLWPYSNEYTAKDYPFARDNGLNWEGDGNKETVFSIKCSNLADWGTTIGYSNQYVLFFGFPAPNGEENTYPFGVGWGNGPVNAQLWDQWEKDEPNDLRREGSIIDIADELPGFSPESFRNWMESTGYWQKKYMPIQCRDENGNRTLYSVLMYGCAYNFQLAHTQDIMLIRFADVLLMQSELKQDVSGINKVRQRAGLAPLSSYSLEALKKERRYELAFEGIRWFDLMRWGDAADALASQVGAPLTSMEKPGAMKDFGVGYRKRYEQTGGFWPIAKTQLDLSNGVLTQSKGWDTPDAEYWGW